MKPSMMQITVKFRDGTRITEPKALCGYCTGRFYALDRQNGRSLYPSERIREVQEVVLKAPAPDGSKFKNTPVVG